MEMTPEKWDFVVKYKNGTKSVLLFDSHEEMFEHVVNWQATQERVPDISVLGIEFGPKLFE